MFKDLMKTGKHVNMGFPIAEVEYNGDFNIAKEKDSGGMRERSDSTEPKLTTCRLCHCVLLCFTTTLRDSRTTVLQLRRHC